MGATQLGQQTPSTCSGCAARGGAARRSSTTLARQRGRWLRRPSSARAVGPRTRAVLRRVASAASRRCRARPGLHLSAVSVRSRSCFLVLGHCRQKPRRGRRAARRAGRGRDAVSSSAPCVPIDDASSSSTRAFGTEVALAVAAGDKPASLARTSGCGSPSHRAFFRASSGRRHRLCGYGCPYELAPGGLAHRAVPTGRDPGRLPDSGSPTSTALENPRPRARARGANTFRKAHVVYVHPNTSSSGVVGGGKSRSNDTSTHKRPLDSSTPR